MNDILVALLAFTASTVAWAPHGPGGGAWSPPFAADTTQASQPIVNPTTSPNTVASPPVPDSSETLLVPTAATTSIAAPNVPTNTATGSTPPVNSTTPAAGGSYTGDITHYDVGDGLGSCGKQFSNSDMVVALSTAMMANGPNPNTNPKCYTSITLTNPSNPGGPWQGEIVSTCAGCAMDDVDLSPALFSAVAPSGDGRVSGISWSFT